MVKSPFTRDETNSLADRVQRSRKRRPSDACDLVPQFTMRAELISLSSWISAEAFDKGHADCNPTDDTYCILNVFRSKRAEKTLDSLDWHNASSGYGINAHLIEGVNSNTGSGRLSP